MIVLHAYNSGKPIKLNGTKTKLPFIGYIRTYESLPNCQVKKVTISKEADGWYLSFAYEQSRPVNPKSNQKVGVTKIAKLYQKAANIRRDLIHKLTTYLTEDFEVIVIEDLNIRGMIANHKLAEAISNQSFYEFRRQLEYKSKIQGNKLIIADRFYPSSKLCSSCGNKKDKLTLNERVYCCEKCNLIIDRDLNAAVVLSKYELVGLQRGKASRQEGAGSLG